MRRFQFSLRALLVVVVLTGPAIFCSRMAIEHFRAWREQRRREKIQELDTEIAHYPPPERLDPPRCGD